MQKYKEGPQAWALGRVHRLPREASAKPLHTFKAASLPNFDLGSGIF